MSLFTSMDVGVLGLKASNTALNTTSQFSKRIYKGLCKADAYF